MIAPLENPCMKCCFGCKKYKTVKEMKSKCETYKERNRIIKRELYKSKKEKRS
ncbi:hypothetical protein [Clostridium botulinum]|uniref:hypothetical protein n=1 Tax=Clostridium botulinum TaxID=1491 RepID=UPI000A851D38|nr:hypothetical protein [Clostridium botulinum]KAI3346257.1 hypothetical protein CIT18_14545 [Clostridium botulinum]